MLVKNEHFIRRNIVSVKQDGKMHVVLTLECGHTKRLHVSVYNDFHKKGPTLCIPCSDKSMEGVTNKK